MTPSAVALYLPAPGSKLGIDHGSGIIGTPEGDRVLIDFEGNRYGAANIVTYYDRVSHAAGRHFERYPTVARMLVRAEELRHIGWFLPQSRTLDIHTDGPTMMALIGWLTEGSDSPNLHIEVRPGSAVIA